MAYSNKEIIKKIEAEVKKIKPTVLSSKRFAFLNKGRLGGQGCEDVVLYIPPGAPGNLNLIRYDHNTQTHTTMSGPGPENSTDIAMWGKKSIK